MHNGRKAGSEVAVAERLRRLWCGARETARLMIGIPDYDRYVAHCRQHHPDRPPMSREAFLRDRLNARYSGPGRRGCC
ncbi:MAG: YbdD/YjiX family protein [Rhodospirillales bacterium]